jgi:protein DGCR14
MLPPPPRDKKRNQEVLEEDEYIAGITQIIERDFFPGLPKLRQQMEVMEAMENNDMARLRELYAQSQRSAQRSTRGESVRGGSVRGGSVRGSSVRSEAWDNATGDTPLRDGDPDAAEKQPAESDADEEVDTTLTLDQFVHKYTSEDNASFEDLIEKDREKQRQQRAWVDAAADKHNIKMLQLKNNAGKSGQAQIEGWNAKAKNSLIFPHSLEAFGRETDVVKGPPKAISHGNTRIDPAGPGGDAGGAAAQAGGAMYSAVGANGMQVGQRLPTESPNVHGFGFVVTPSPMPGVDDSPLMTWGTLESTPLRIALDSGAMSGPKFNLAPTPSRDELGHELASEVREKRAREQSLRKKQKMASGRAGSASGAAPFPVMRSSRVSSLSPAAQLLLGRGTPSRGRAIGSDSQLRARCAVTPLSPSSQARTVCAWLSLAGLQLRAELDAPPEPGELGIALTRLAPRDHGQSRRAAQSAP